MRVRREKHERWLGVESISSRGHPRPMEDYRKLCDSSRGVWCHHLHTPACYRVSLQPAFSHYPRRTMTIEKILNGGTEQACRLRSTILVWRPPLRPRAPTSRRSKIYAPNRPHALRAHPRSSGDADPVCEELHELAPIIATAPYEEAYGAHLTPKVNSHGLKMSNAYCEPAKK